MLYRGKKQVPRRAAQAGVEIQGESGVALDQRFALAAWAFPASPIPNAINKLVRTDFRKNRLVRIRILSPLIMCLFISFSGCPFNHTLLDGPSQRMLPHFMFKLGAIHNP